MTSPVTDAVSKVKFLLTHPVWDVTVHHVKHVRDYPISTHTSRVGCDTMPILPDSWHRQFLLTHPVWDVTEFIKYSTICDCISTHTSRVGCDRAWGKKGRALPLFLLTHPVWDVTHFLTLSISAHIFLLTHPVWDVTRRGELQRIREIWDFYSHIPCGMWPILLSPLSWC